LLRFFENRSLAEIGQRLGFGESGASRRISRALEKLRIRLGKRGIVTTATALTAALSAHGVEAAPVGMASVLSSAALSSAATPVSNLFLLKLMASMKLKLGIAALAATALVVPIAITRHLRLQQDEVNRSARRQIGTKEDIPATQRVGGVAKRMLAGQPLGP
jgi:Sigma-70, region 4